MILAIDAGNTRIKWGVHDGNAWVAAGAVETRAAERLGESWASAPPARQAIASNVAGVGVGADLERACAGRGMALRVIASQARELGVVNGYSDPGQLGSDRWAALVGAHRLEPGHKLVVNVGTALTIDALAGDGRFLGGLIVPGPALMRRSLDRGTAGLRHTDGRFEEFPRSTPDAITSGAIQAAAGAIAQMRDAMARIGLAPGRVILSGGAAGELAPHLPIGCAIHENLVLDGLALIARHA
jgi:type III pantothenate kinase